MATETMTIHEALREIKTLDKRIRDTASKLNDACTITKKRDKMIGSETVEEWTKRQRETYDSFTDLCKRRNAIKMAISDSNAKTTVVIPAYSETPISIAAAIDLQKYALQYEEQLVVGLTNTYNLTKAKYEIEKAKIEAQADKNVESTFGNNTSKDVDPKAISEYRETYIENNKVTLQDPINIQKVVADLANKNDAIRTQIDSRISVSNATTTITVSY